jgi:molecular chaperone DnaJ
MANKMLLFGKRISP